MTPSPAHRPAKIVNPASALASAEDDFISEVHAFYDPANPDHDLRELEALAVLTAEFASRAAFIIGRMEYAAHEPADLTPYLLDVISDQLQHDAGAVVKAHVLRIQS